MSADYIAATKYAKATLELAEEKGVALSVLDELMVVSEMFGSGEGQVILNHPMLPADKKKSVIQQVLQEKVSPITISLLHLLIDKRRGSLLETIAGCYKEQFQATQSRQAAKVTTALPLTEEQMKQLKIKLEAFTGKDIDLEVSIEKGLKAGTKVELGDLLLDGTLAGRIEQLRKTMTSEN